MVQTVKTFQGEYTEETVYSIKNSMGMEMQISTLGARILSLTAPDRNGNFSDVLMGLANAEDYVGKRKYFGATIGRYGNRIGKSKFTLNGQEYLLNGNEGENLLHGGKCGFDLKHFDAKVSSENAIAMHYLSKDLEEGFPGNLDLTVTFTLTNDGALDIFYDAISDKDTVCNLTNHAYFNIGNDEDILEQVLDIQSSYITPTDDALIPHNELLAIDNTPFSFKGGVKLGKNMFSNEHLIAHCHGFDFNYCLDRKTPHELEKLITLYDEKSGRYMEVSTTLPGVQLYTSNTVKGQEGKKIYPNYAALCLETQGYPNSPNCESYPSTFLKAGEKYQEETVYKFLVK